MNQSVTSNQSQLYKFKELKVYSSTEWLANNTKKYRQVFDKYDTSYIYVELSLFNKRFDEENWEVDIQLKCFELKKNRKKLCELNIKKKVSKYDPVTFIREGWGNKKEGVFWNKGTYYWEASVDGEKIATKYFYIEDPGKILDPRLHPYMDLHSLKLYEAQYDDVGEGDRVYMKVFSSEQTRYIYAEIVFRNNNVNEDWYSELFIKFFNEARELKGVVTKLQLVKNGEKFIHFIAGWGTNLKGSWTIGSYTLELVMFEDLIAVLPFEVDEDFVEGVLPVHLHGGSLASVLMPDEDLTVSFDEAMAKLNKMIGLTKIKQQVLEHSEYIKFVQLRRMKGFEEASEINVHSVFIGNPGTGKTTVAKQMGVLYKKMGLLSKGHVHEVDRVDLVGEYIGQTAPKVRAALETARGGILFIDEAYALARSNDDSKDFGREVIELLVKEMSNGIGDLVIIVAGYPRQMDYFLNSNPGLKSRFKHHYEFADYLPQELSEIARIACDDLEVNLESRAGNYLDEIITEAYRNRDEKFGNARYVIDLFEKAKINMGLRIMGRKYPHESSRKDLETILIGDLEKISHANKKQLAKIPIDNVLLNESLAELNGMIGMDDIKKEIAELVEIVKYHKISKKDVLNKFFLHTVFVGNPGTGKTTVARILAKIYKGLGILEKGHIVETDRQGLVAGYVGQTAIKTAKKIEEAIGGVLFIDEAYALTSAASSMNDFGNEAIQTLLKVMEDRRGEFFVFVAGYPDNMEGFLKANPGFSSRFERTLKFNDYTPEELLSIAQKMIDQEGYNINKKALNALKTLLEKEYQQRDRYFGNARRVRNMVFDIINKYNLRVYRDASAKQKKASNTIIYQDVVSSESDVKNVFERRSIGYGR